MSSTFVDTSAIYAFLVPQDRKHQAARTVFAELQHEGAELVTSSFVLHEAIALLQSRIGVEAVRSFDRAVAPLLQVVWIDAPLYRRALAALMASGNRRVSLTDWSSFEVMRVHQLKTAFAFDPHFVHQGFQVRPE